MMNRRSFLQQSTISALALYAPGAFLPLHAETGAEAPAFSCEDRQWTGTYRKALDTLAKNVQILPHYPRPVLIEGSEYAGIWQESGPYEALLYREFRSDVARDSHMIFFRLQKPDGQLPANNKRSETGFGQIQMVVPIAATAWEVAEATGDQELLEIAYLSCSRWDDWLMRYRNTRGTGLVEDFCCYDTGMDNSPRWRGMPRQCPDKDARKCPPVPTLPRLCPDLSATVYGGRLALAKMARTLGKRPDADRWSEKAEQIRGLILKKLFVPEDAAFYDLDARNHFVRIRTCVLMRVCGEHVVEQTLFDELWNRQIHNPKAFWPQYPFPSVALDDPSFVRPIPRNSWGGASQALTALRAERWLEHYGRTAEFSTLMEQWCHAILRDDSFRQQLDPLGGDFTAGGSPGYSPCALVFIGFTWRLAGVIEKQRELHWNVRPGQAVSRGGQFRRRTKAGHDTQMRYDSRGAELTFHGKKLGYIDGVARLVSDLQGRPRSLVGIDESSQPVVWTERGQPARRFTLRPNEQVKL